MNQCGECTLCCYLFQIDDLNKNERTQCEHCTTKCEIYDDRPQGCLGFDCAWLQIPNAPIELRPDKLGVVFEKINDHLFHGTVDDRMRPTEHAKGQVQSFLNQGYSVILRFPFNKHEVILAEGHDRETMIQELKDHARLKYGSTNI